MRIEKNTRKFTAAAAFFAVLIGVAVLSYRAVFLKGRIPDYPTVKFNPEDEKQALDDLTKRSADYHPNAEESALIAKLEEIHLAETGEETEVPTASLERRVEELSRALHAQAAKDRPRFIATGDYLAGRFQRALDNFLAGDPTKDHRLSTEAMRLTITGGAFLSTALRKKMINPNHSLNISKALPQVLFRYRWRVMGGLLSTLGFSTFEQRLLYDFTIRYVDKNQVKRRIDAVKSLSKLQADYDATVAEALVLFEADKTEEAVKVLDTKIAGGNTDKTVIDFRQALSRI